MDDQREGGINPAIFSVKIQNKTKFKTSSLITRKLQLCKPLCCDKTILVLDRHFLFVRCEQNLVSYFVVFNEIKMTRHTMKVNLKSRLTPNNPYFTVGVEAPKYVIQYIILDYLSMLCQCAFENSSLFKSKDERGGVLVVGHLVYLKVSLETPKTLTDSIAIYFITPVSITFTFF